MRFLPRFLMPVILVGLTFSTSAICAQETTAKSSYETILPFLEQETIAVIRLDATRIDLESIATQVETVLPLEGADRAGFMAARMAAAGWIEAFRSAGGRDAYVVVSLVNPIDQMLCVVIPLHEGANAEAIKNLLPSGTAIQNDAVLRGMEPTEWNGAILLTHANSLNRIKRNAGQRAIPQEAFARFEKFGIQLLFLPNQDHQRVIDEFLPGVVASESRDPATQTSLGIEWGGVGIDAIQQLAARIEIHTKHEQAARGLHRWITRLSEQIVATTDARNQFPEIDRVMRMLTPTVQDNRVQLEIDTDMAKKLATLLTKPVQKVRSNVRLNASSNSLKHLGLAMHNFHDVYKQFPPAAIRDDEGKPLLSWRVAVLPFTEESALYEEFHLDEPWDSEHNKQLIPRMPRIYATSNATLRAEGKTTLVVPIGEQTVFGSPEGIPIRDITDGTSNTLMILDADDKQAVIWTKPDDLPIDDVKNLKAHLFGSREEGFSALFADGSWRTLSQEISEESLRAILTRNARDIFTLP